MAKLGVTKKNIKKVIRRLDERLIDFLFGQSQGYLWGQRCQTDAHFKNILLQQGGFLDVHMESRLLYDELVPFTIFKTPCCEIAFNMLSWQAGNLSQNYLSNANLFLFRNQQRLISVTVNQAPHFIADHNRLDRYRVSESEIHWTQQNTWLNDYLDFIKRIELMLNHPSIQPPTECRTAAHIKAYQFGYRLAKWLYRSKKNSA
jgi:hypothetical protein